MRRREFLSVVTGAAALERRQRLLAGDLRQEPVVALDQQREIAGQRECEHDDPDGRPDRTRDPGQQHFDDLFFSTGVLPHGSVKEYYSEVTNGLVTLTGSVRMLPATGCTAAGC